MLTRNNPFAAYVKLLQADIERQRVAIEETKKKISKARLDEFRKAWATNLELEERILVDNMEDLRDLFQKQEAWFKEHEKEKLRG